MGKRIARNLILIGALFLFSWWLMSKSFGYEAPAWQFRIARHEVGDFGIHIGLIRSFAWGENHPSESPFFSGTPLVYHYWVDWLAGFLVRRGIRIDHALNGISAVALTVLLYGLYRLTIHLYGSSAVGLLSIALFFLPSNLSFIEIFTNAPKNFSFFAYFWRFPDYLHKGPFDGSVVTIYTTLAPYLNQRHLIAGMAIGIIIILMIVSWLSGKKRIPDSRWALVGLVIGLATRVHVVVAAATGLVTAVLLIRKKNKALLYLTVSAILVAAPHLIQIVSVRSGSGLSQLWNPGYLAARPLSATFWVSFWIYNLGIIIFLIPLAYRLADGLGRRIMIGAGALFIVANTLQVSYRIEHNHSLINYATTLTLPFIAHLLLTWWRRRSFTWRITAVCALVLATVSGLFNLMVVKNDYQVMVDDVPKSAFMQWVQTKTAPSSTFISGHTLYDPVNLAGRKNYLGAEYYVTVMGYDYWGRRKQIDTWLNNFDKSTITEMKKQHITYIAIPKDRKDFPYTVDEEKVENSLSVAYQDDFMTVYAL